jgi:hypothetical protein
MAPLRTGKRYEIVFGPGINLATAAQGGAIDLAFEQVCGVDPTAVVLSAASDGLKVVGSEIRAAIEAGRDACSIRCRSYDRNLHTELTTDAELARHDSSIRVWAEVERFDARSAGASPQRRRGATFKIRP